MKEEADKSSVDLWQSTLGFGFEDQQSEITEISWSNKQWVFLSHQEVTGFLWVHNMDST